MSGYFLLSCTAHVSLCSAFLLSRDALSRDASSLVRDRRGFVETLGFLAILAVLAGTERATPVVCSMLGSP